MASRVPGSARTPSIRGPQPGAESTPLPRPGRPQPATRPEREERRIVSRIDEELGSGLDSQAFRGAGAGRRRLDSVSSEASGTESGSGSGSGSGNYSPSPRSRARDANRNLPPKRLPETARPRLSTDVRKRIAVAVAGGRDRGDAARRGPSRPSGGIRTGPRGDAATKRRARPYARVMREIRRFRSMHGPEAYGLLIRRAPFSRLVREITNEVRDKHRMPDPIRWHVEALLALQEASEALLAHFFEDTNVLAAHARRITIMNRDAHTLMRLRQDR